MNWSKLFFWSSVLTLPTLFMLPRKKGVVLPGPEVPGPDGDPIVTEPSAPPEPFDTMPAEFRIFVPPPLPGYSRMSSGVTPAMVTAAQAMLASPLGTVKRLAIAGRDIVAVVEPHYHDPASGKKPVGWHKGVSLFEREGVLA